jgi:dihydroneopterin aldolase
MENKVTVIEIIDYPVFVKLGCFDVEKLHGQEVLISVEASLSSARDSGTTDNLSLTVDYGSIIKFIDELYSFKDVNLIETILNDLGQGILKTFENIEKVNLSVEKSILPESIAKSGRVKIRRNFSR